MDVKKQKQDRTEERGRFSAKRKKEAVLRLLKGEELDALSRELGVTAAVLSEWREKFLAGAEANLKSREPEPADDEVLRLKAMVGALMMKTELLAEKARLLEGNAPCFPWRKSRG
ncbi:transposase [Myxococcus sp. XM-1-1-1]|nr:transposase [Myxococcus sp. XM-1-1-1]